MAPAVQSLADRYPVALVTGASSGIGAAIATALAGEGITVYGTTRDPEKPDLAKDLRWLPFEGASREGIEAFIKANGELLSNVNLLINNAGSSCFGEVSQLSEHEIEGQLCLLAEAPVKLTRAVLPAMRRAGGAIVNISSLAAEFPMPHMATYSAGKAALSAFTQSLLLTERGAGLIILDFQPGDFKTPFNDNQAATHGLNESEKAAWERIEHHLRTAPEAERAAQDLVKALEKGRSGIIRTGGMFQKTVAPLLSKWLPRRLILWGISRYYRIPRR